MPLPSIETLTGRTERSGGRIVTARSLPWMPAPQHRLESLAWTDAVAAAVSPQGENGAFESYYDLLACIEGLPFPFQDQAMEAFLDIYGAALWPQEQDVNIISDPGVTFREFTEMAWTEIEPSQTYLSNWHIDCICEHLEAITWGQITRLLINVPPGHAKSLLVSVLYPAWQWLVQPSWRILCATHTLELALRDAIRCRNLIESDWYQSTFAPSWQLHRAQKSKRYYTNTQTGSRFSVSVGASVTGFRGSALMFDDLLDAKKAFSKRKREDTLLWLDQAAMNRLNDLKKGAVIAIAQRLHEKDPPGHFLEMGGFELVMLPSRFESRRAFATVLIDLKNHQGEPYQYAKDPRTIDGELLFPALFPEEVIQREEKRLASGFSGQHQQNPDLGEGSMFRNEHFCPDSSGLNFWPYPHGLAIQDAILSIDNATKAASQNDFLAISLHLFCADGYLYMVPLNLERCSLEVSLKQIMLAWARLKLGGVSTDGVDYPRLDGKLRMARIESGLAGEPIDQQARILLARSRHAPTEDEKILAAAAALKDNSTVLSALESQASRAVAALSPPSDKWTQEEWDLVRSAPPLILNPYPNSGQGDIMERAARIAPFCHARNVRLVEMKGLSIAGAWLAQLTTLPNGEHDDAVQSTIGGVMPYITQTVGAAESASGDDILAKMKQGKALQKEGAPSTSKYVNGGASEMQPAFQSAIFAALAAIEAKEPIIPATIEEAQAIVEALKVHAKELMKAGQSGKAIGVLAAIRQLNALSGL